MLVVAALAVVVVAVLYHAWVAMAELAVRLEAVAAVEVTAIQLLAQVEQAVQVVR